jgi:hypothetical protein
MTFVSTKYPVIFGLIFYPLEVPILSDVGHARERLGEALGSGPQQQRFEQGPMLGLGAATVLSGTLLERIDDPWIEVADNEVCHGTTYQAAEK